jgi:hypothetical protein
VARVSRREPASVIIVNYSLPTTGEPGESQGKFVQLYWLNEEYLVFAPRDLYGYHVQILSRFLDDRQIPYKWLDSQQLLVKDSRLNVVGGGKFVLNPARQALKLWDNSQAFGRFEEAGIIQRISETFHPWHSFEISVD